LGCPLGNLHNRRVAFSAVPAQGYLGKAMGVAPPNKFTMAIDYVSPKMRDAANPNQDVDYGFGVVVAR